MDMLILHMVGRTRPSTNIMRRDFIPKTGDSREKLRFKENLENDNRCQEHGAPDLRN